MSYKVNDLRRLKKLNF